MHLHGVWRGGEDHVIDWRISYISHICIFPCSKYAAKISIHFPLLNSDINLYAHSSISSELSFCQTGDISTISMGYRSLLTSST